MSVKGWTTVFKGNRLHADVIAAALMADGLRVEVFGDFGFGVGIGIDFTDVSVMVPDAQADGARRLIKEAEQAPIAFEPEEEV